MLVELEDTATASMFKSDVLADARIVSMVPHPRAFKVGSPYQRYRRRPGWHGLRPLGVQLIASQLVGPRPLYVWQPVPPSDRFVALGERQLVRPPRVTRVSHLFTQAWWQPAAPTSRR
jgi:hypothetical protein